MEQTLGSLLGGRVAYAQPRTGFRSGIEPVLLAATIPARAGQVVIEGGCGAAAGLLCLAARVPGIHGLGVEQDPALAAVARQNLAANHLHSIDILAADLITADLPEADHAFANPPYHLGVGTAPVTTERRRAKHAGPGVIRSWVRALAAPLRHRGTLTLILSAGAAPEAIVAMTESHCAPSLAAPLWPRPQRPAKLLLLQAVKDGRNTLRIVPGLVLHEPSGRFTEATERVLRHGAAFST